jgi:hypothetical protein
LGHKVLVKARNDICDAIDAGFRWLIEAKPAAEFEIADLGRLPGNGEESQ